MKLSLWTTVSDLISITQTPFEKIIEVFDKKSKIYHSLSPEFIFNSLKEAGVDGLELLVTKHTSEKDIEKIKKVLDKYVIPVLSIHQSLSNKKPFSLDEAERLCKVANIFSASVVVLHSTTLGKSLTNDEFISGLKKLQNKYHVRFGIENMSKSPFKAKTFMYDSIDFARAVKNAELFMTFDTTHLGQTGGDILNFYISNKEQIINIHISDYRSHWINKNLVSQAYTHLPLNEGQLPIEKLLTLLKKNSYNGLITMEINSGLIQLCNSAKFIKSVLARV